MIETVGSYDEMHYFGLDNRLTRYHKTQIANQFLPLYLGLANQ